MINYVGQKEHIRKLKEIEQYKLENDPVEEKLRNILMKLRRSMNEYSQTELVGANFYNKLSNS